MSMKTSLVYICDDSRHLICIPYSIENLHQMAEDLHIKRCWYHSGKHPHYDIPKKMVESVKKRCLVNTSKELLSIIKTNL